MVAAGQPALARRERAAHTARRSADVALRLHLPLIATYVVAAAVSIRYAADVNTWKVMTDELQYVRLALSFGEDDTVFPRIHGESIGTYNVLYSILIAPLWWVLDAPEAFQASHVLNALVMASAVFPAYLIARGAGLSRWVSYLAGALVVAVPWLTLTTLLFTEVAAYPAFLWAVAGMQRALYAPGPRSDLLAVGGIVLAFFARTQFVVLAPLLPVAILAHELGRQPFERPRPSFAGALRAALRSVWDGHRTLIVVYAVGAVGIWLLFPGGFHGALGSYSGTARGDILPPGTVSASTLNVVLTGLALGLIPVILATAWALAALVRFPGRREHALAVLGLLLVPAVAIVATSFNLRYQLGFSQERYHFYVAPLLLIGMLACLAGTRRPWLAVAVAGAAVVWRLQPADLSALDPPLFSSPGQAFYRVLDGRVYDLGRELGFNNLSHEPVIAIGGLAATAAIAVALRSLRKTWLVAAVGCAVLLYGTVQTLYLFPRATERGTGGPTSARIPLAERDWIDDNVPGDADVALVPGDVLFNEFENAVVWWTVELFNKRATHTFSYPGSTYYTPFASQELFLDRRTGRLRAPFQPPYLVVPRNHVRFRPAAVRRFAHPIGLLAGAEMDAPYRVDWASFGVDGDHWTVANPRVRFYPQPGRARTERRVRVELSLPQGASRRRYRLSGVAKGAAGVIAGGQRREETVCVSVPQGRPRDLHIEVRRTPSGEGRRVGVRLESLTELQLPAAGCG